MAHVQYYIGYRCIIQRFKTFKVIFDLWASLVTQMVKNPPVVWKTWVQSLGWEDPLEEGMVTHSSILAWRIHTN